MSPKFNHAILGGTFDYLHTGHKRFIDAACKSSKKVTIGITTEKLLDKKIHKRAIQSFTLRKKTLNGYLKIRKYKNVSIVPLFDIIGAGLEEDVDAIFAIDESRKNAELINKKRLEKGLSKAKIIIVPMLRAQDGDFISSKRIRAGEINREGKSYISLFEKTLKLPEKLRPALRKPFGKIIGPQGFKEIKDQNIFTVAIGDIVVANFMKIDLQPDLSIFDLKTHRDPVSKEILKLLPSVNKKVKNEHSTINEKAVEILFKSIQKVISEKKKIVIEVNGEEDLLAIPAILLAPLGTKVFYGIRKIGGIMVDTTEEKKNEVKKLLKEFEA